MKNHPPAPNSITSSSNTNNRVFFPLNTIINGNTDEILPLLPDNSIDLTVTSPPYDKMRDYHGYSFNFEKLAQNLFRITKPGGVLVWVIGDSTIDGSETGSSFKQALRFKEIGFNLHDTMIYEKSGFAFPSKRRYHQIFEYMFVFSKGRPKTFNPLMDRPNKSQFTFSKKRRRKDGTMTHTGDTSRISIEKYGKRFNIWRYKTGKGHTTKDECAYSHPALFPEKLAQDHILSWSNEGEIILDPLNGAGTTTKMAYALGRKFIGIEISRQYCEIALERVKALKSNDPSLSQEIYENILTL